MFARQRARWVRAEWKETTGRMKGVTIKDGKVCAWVAFTPRIFSAWINRFTPRQRPGVTHIIFWSKRFKAATQGTLRNPHTSERRLLFLPAWTQDRRKTLSPSDQHLQRAQQHHFCDRCCHQSGPSFRKHRSKGRDLLRRRRGRE